MMCLFLRFDIGLFGERCAVKIRQRKTVCFPQARLGGVAITITAIQPLKGRIMKHSKLTKLAIAALLFIPMTASAEYMEVLEQEVKEGCTVAKYQVIIDDFNVWAKDYGYQAKIASPLYTNNFGSVYWIGTAKDTTTFGAAYDAWLDGIKDPKSTPAKLDARMGKCVKLKTRRAYTVN